MNGSFFERFTRNRFAVAGTAFLAVVVLISLSAPLIFQDGPFVLVGAPFQPMFGEWILGTDSLGRNVAACLAYGGLTSITIGLVATIVSVTIGVTVGAISGYYGGLVDDILMRATEFFQTVPAFLFAIVIIAIMSPSNTSIVTAIVVVGWPPVARLVRGEYIRLRSQEFVQAAVSLGMRDRDVIMTQILPNVVSPVIVTGSLMIATAVLTEAALSFLGLGDPNAMSWGFMIGAGRSFLRDAWWLCAIPGCAILLTVLSINMIGDGLNDALNPRLSRLSS